MPDGLLRAGTNWFVWAWGAVMAAIEAGPELPTLSMENFENRARELALAALNLSNNGVLPRRNEAVTLVGAALLCGIRFEATCLPPSPI